MQCMVWRWVVPIDLEAERLATRGVCTLATSEQSPLRSARTTGSVFGEAVSGPQASNDNRLNLRSVNVGCLLYTETNCQVLTIHSSAWKRTARVNLSMERLAA